MEKTRNSEGFESEREKKNEEELRDTTRKIFIKSQTSRYNYYREIEKKRRRKRKEGMKGIRGGK